MILRFEQITNVILIGCISKTMYHTTNETTTTIGLCTATVIEGGWGRFYTMELVYPRYIHSELMTHRLFSRNASSSRATPVEKIIKEVKDNPVIPNEVYKNCKGMSGKELLNKEEMQDFQVVWDCARDNAIYWAERLKEMGVHKQTVNRLLEPFSFIRTIVTATEWDNFFELRISDAAQPEIRDLAMAIQEAQDKKYYIPECHDGNYFWIFPYLSDEEAKDLSILDSIKVSAARCARVSYMQNDDYTPADIKKDIELADRLLKEGHMSPFEHQVYYDDDMPLGWHYNLYGRYKSARYLLQQNSLV